MQRPPLLIQSSQRLQFSARFHQLVLGSLDLRNECFHSKLCQLGRKTDCCKSKCNHADSAKHIGFFSSLFKATSFYCKSFKSTFPKAFRRSCFISGSKILRECSTMVSNMVLSSKLKTHPRVTVGYQVLHISLLREVKRLSPPCFQLFQQQSGWSQTTEEIQSKIWISFPILGPSNALPFWCCANQLNISTDVIMRWLLGPPYWWHCWLPVVRKSPAEC